MIGRLIELQRQRHRQRLSASQLGHLRTETLQRLVEHAYRNVPYYRDHFDSAGLNPSDIKGSADLHRIPVSTRPGLQGMNANRRIDQSADLAAIAERTTSGSSGKPFSVFLDPREIRIREAVQFRSLLAMGVRPRDRIVVLGPPRPHRQGLHEKLGFFRSEHVSPMLPLEEQYRKICGFDPTVLWVYPTVFQALYEHVGRPLGEWLHVRQVISSAEVFREDMSRRVEEDLGIEPFNCYGSVEFGRIAWECPTHQGLHINADQLIVECVEDGHPVPPGKSGSIVITSLHSFASPLIRYELGDIGSLHDRPCSCGSPFPLMGHPEGRQNEMLVLPSGRRLSPFVLIFPVSDASASSRFRMIQHRRDFIEVLYVNQREKETTVTTRIRRALENKFEEPVELLIRKIDHIPNEGHKFKAFISHLQ